MDRRSGQRGEFWLRPRSASATFSDETDQNGLALMDRARQFIRRVLPWAA